MTWIEERIQPGEDKDPEKKKPKSRLVPASMESVLKGGFGGTGTEYEERATEVQLAFERWVLKGSGCQYSHQTLYIHHLTSC